MKRKTILSVMLVLGLGISVISCEKVTKDDSDLSRYVGRYRIESSHIATPMNLNGDYALHYDILQEFSGLPGFVEDWIHGEVTLEDDGSLLYRTAFPAYLSYPALDKFEVQFFESKNIVRWTGAEFYSDDFKLFYSESAVGPKSVRVEGYDLKPDSYTLRVQHSFLNEKNIEEQQFLYFYFVKE